jgi:hypothetical protein
MKRRAPRPLRRCALADLPLKPSARAVWLLLLQGPPTTHDLVSYRDADGRFRRYNLRFGARLDDIKRVLRQEPWRSLRLRICSSRLVERAGAEYRLERRR